MTIQVLENLKVATISDNSVPYGLIPDGAIAIEGKKIAWCGQRMDLPGKFHDWPRHDLKRALVTPTLVDCHTHIVYGGNRASEFEMRLNGSSYEEITSRGGGIHSTVRETRRLSVEQLVTKALPRVDALISEGVGAIEIKSGYGLDIQTELNMLRAARQIADCRRITVRTSFLGAHVTPGEYRNRPNQYLYEVCIPTLNRACEESLVDAVDGFCESIAFSADHIDQLFDHAQTLGLPVKLHAEQLSNCGGTQLAAKYGALSADHLEFANEEDVRSLSESGTVAVLLPGAFYALKQLTKPPVSLFREYNVPVAVATDCNPGSSPLNSILMSMNLSCVQFDLTPQEALSGTTNVAASALGLQDTGRIESGLDANLAVWDVESPAELAYYMGFNPLLERMYEGEFDSACQSADRSVAAIA